MKTTKLRAKWDRLPPEELERLQMAQLRRYLRNVVLPFSPYYGGRISRELVPSLRRFRDLEKLPFTSKRDLLNSREYPARTRDFVISPEETILRHRPATFLRALLRGRATVAQELAREFRPVLSTSTTGRSSDPIPFLYSCLLYTSDAADEYQRV